MLAGKEVVYTFQRTLEQILERIKLWYGVQNYALQCDIAYFKL